MVHLLLVVDERESLEKFDTSHDVDMLENNM